jgi:hypothetical protein
MNFRRTLEKEKIDASGRACVGGLKLGWSLADWKLDRLFFWDLCRGNGKI